MAPLGRLLALAAASKVARAAWLLRWADEFDGPTVNTTNWNIYANVSECQGPSCNQIELYTANNVFIDAVDGRSALVLRTQPQNVTAGGHTYNVTSGRVDTLNKVNVTYGRVEVNARLQNDAAASGIHTAHWMLGYECWPMGAEIDIMESQSPGDIYQPGPAGDAPLWQKVTSAYHYSASACNKDTPHSTGGSYYPHAPTSAFNMTRDWTTFAVEWNATDLVYYVNATQVNHVWNGMPGWKGPMTVPTWPMYILLSQAYMAHRPYGDPPAWAWPIQQYIDYVRVYQWVPNAGEGEAALA